MLSRASRILGYVLLIAGALFIAIGLLATWYYEGFSKLQEVMSPFNVWQYIASVITLAPGMFFIWLSDKLSWRLPLFARNARGLS